MKIAITVLSNASVAIHAIYLPAYLLISLTDKKDIEHMDKFPIAVMEFEKLFP